MLRFFFLFFPLAIFSNEMACCRNQISSSFCPYRYIGVEFGGSWSSQADINAPSPQWDPALEGYNANLGSSPIYGFIFGYHFVKWFRGDISYQYRPSFCYEKFQQTESLSGNKIRNFDLENQAILFNGYLQASGIPCLGCIYLCGMVIDPFIGGGVGIAYNRLSSFHSESIAFPGEVFSMMVSKLTSNFSWQAGLGLDFRCCCATFSVGYRYFYGGKFESNDYIIDDPDNTSLIFEGVAVSPWSGKVKANELYATIRFPF